jgi:hypothetical protein
VEGNEFIPSFSRLHAQMLGEIIGRDVDKILRN